LQHPRQKLSPRHPAPDPRSAKPCLIRVHR
jgi:hypothetical protein